MRTTQFLLIIGLTLSINTELSATVVFGSDGLIQGGDRYSDLVLVYDSFPDTPTTLSMTGGVIFGGLHAYDNSTVNISGGEVMLALLSYQTSTINISGGNALSTQITATGSSTINFIDGYMDSAIITATDTSTVNLSSVGAYAKQIEAYARATVNFDTGFANDLYAYSFSTINIAGGGVGLLVGDDFSTVNITAGEVFEVYALLYNITNISGGGPFLHLSAQHSAVVNIYGYGFNYNPVRNILTGFWQDSTPFYMSFEDDTTYDHVNLHTTNPEPATYTLTIAVIPNDIDINTVTPTVGDHNTIGLIILSAERFVNCPDVYEFDYWQGDVYDANSPTTSVFVDSNTTVTAVFYDARECGDQCHPYPSGDLNEDCLVNRDDAIWKRSQFKRERQLINNHWLECTRPECD